ncbi:unnamed protein product [Echinostoma caproni]|uniref:Transposase n=1 Tax=Echinostoma caproni TaxID=27848 RepID=A0A183A2U1_9TREM|nr:unnamed protein product [Echinostoma caproni]
MKQTWGRFLSDRSNFSQKCAKLDEDHKWHGAYTNEKPIDNGSDTTPITKLFTVKNHIATRRSFLTISTMNGTIASSADQTSVTLVSLDSGECVEVTEGFIMDDMPMRAVESIGELVTRWTHLRDLHLEETDSPEIDL